MAVQNTKPITTPSRAELSQLRVLTFEEGCIYTGYARSTMHKLTSAGIIPFGKPNGKSIFFDREKLDAWILSNANPGQQDRETAAATYITSNRKGVAA